ncbi:MAG: chitobiase/beta-hexosaminidase C-terminal domain-containing protein [Paludibacteraceae bacterium]|nr:chitobiase/beta-hexosaminidase C-terminal domain-containing protein [Paludibacteraceae bacterium]
MSTAYTKDFLNAASDVANLVSSVSTATKVYWAKGSGSGDIPDDVLKVGTASNAGALAFTIGGSDNISKVEITGYAWKIGTTVSVNSSASQSPDVAQEIKTYTFELATASKSINISIGTSALCITEIKLYKTSSGSTPVATPTFSPAEGTYSSTQSVTISCATTGATIYYTTDDSTPTTSSTTYGGAISVSSTTTIKAIATKSGMDNSGVASATYTITGGGGGGGGTCSVFHETFDDCDGTGGNDGTWSGISGATSDISADETGWSFEKGYAASECARFGASKGNGYATTPSISVTNGTSYTLSFKAAPWGTESSTMTVTVTGGTINSYSSVTTEPMTGSQWNSYEYTIVATASSMTIEFNASQNRFFLDEVCMDVAGPTYTITATVDDPAHGSVSVSGNTITVTPTAGWVPNSATVSPANSATVSQSGNIFTVTPTSDCSITIGFRAANTYTVTLKDNGKTTTSTATEGVPFELPDEGDSNCDDATFLGWATGEYTDHLTGTTTEPTYDAPGTEKDITAATTFTAVYGIAAESASNDYTKITSLSALTTGDYVIAAHGSYGEYAMKNEVLYSSYMDEETLTKNENPITTTDATIIWRITKTGSNYTIYNANVNKYLATSTSDGPVLQTDPHNFTIAYSGSNWVFQSTTNEYYITYNGYFRSLSAVSTDFDIYLYKRGAGIGSYTSKPKCCQAPATALSIESDVTTMVASGVAHLTLNGGNGKNITWSTTGGSLTDKTNDGATLTLSAPGVYTVTATQPDDETDPDNIICGATVTVNITVKAQYTITFNTKDNGVVSEYSRITVIEGNTYTMPDISEDYDCGTSGASFAGWVDDLNDTSIEAAKGSTQTATSDKTWYAAWSTSGSIKNVFLYTKVTSTSELTDGCTVLIGNTAGTYAMGASKGNNRYAEVVSQNPDNENQIYFTGTDVKELTLGISGSYYTFYDSEEAGYLYAASSSSNYLKTQTTLDDNGKFAITITSGAAVLEAKGSYTHNLLQYNNSSKIFACYLSGQATPAIYKKSATTIPVTEAGTTITTDNTSCDKGATIIAETGKWITAANGQTVKLELPVTARGFESAATLGAVSSNNNFAISLAATAVPVAPSTLATTLTIEYTPTTAEEIENTTITLSAGEVTKNIVVNGRSLPDEFVIIAKKTLWYALPANMHDGADVYDGVQVTPDDASDPTLVSVAPSTTVYSLRAVAADRYAAAGNCVRLVGNSNKCLWANAASSSPGNTRIQNYAVLGSTNGSNYEWLLTTTDGVHYTISNPAHPEAASGRVLANGGTGGTQFGLYKSETTFFLLPIGCSSQPGEVNVRPRRTDVTISWVSNASTMTIDLYTNEARTEGHIAVTATSSPKVITDLEETTDYWYTLTPGSDDACAIQGQFKTTGPTIDIVEWQEDGVVLFIDKGDINPLLIIDGQEEHGSISGGGGTATDLFFAKYFEGAGEMKLLSVFNGTGSEISFNSGTTYKIRQKSAGSSATSYSGDNDKVIDFTSLEKIRAGQEIIFFTRPQDNCKEEKLHECSNAFLTSVAKKNKVSDNPRWIELSSTASNGMNFNGNDALVLLKDDVPIDVFGAASDPAEALNHKNCRNEPGWGNSVPNMDYSKTASDFPDLDLTSNTLADYSIDVTNENIDLTTARCILFRSNEVTSGEKAVALNTTDFVTFGAHTYLGESYTSEWYGRSVCKSSSDCEALGWTYTCGGSDYRDNSAATCNSYVDLASIDYEDYYIDYTSHIEEGKTLDSFTHDDETKLYTIDVDNLAQYSCLNVRFQLKNNKTDEEPITEATQQVPILVTGSKDTNDPLFSELVVDKVDENDPSTWVPSYAESVKRCKTCNVVILNNATLTKGSDSDPNDVPEIANLKLYPGGKLVVPTGTEYTVKSLAFRRQEDELASADIQGTLNIGTTNSTYLDIRIDPSNWHYISLPYDCNVSDIRFANEDEVSRPILGTDYLLKWYNGEKRAETQAGGCWEMVKADAVLKKGLGYIIALPGSGKVKRELRFPMANDVITDDLTNKTVTGLYGFGCDKSYTEVRANHRGWNLIGNPYLLPYSSNIENPVLNGEIVEDHSVDPWNGYYKFKDPVNDLRYIVEPVDNGRSEYRQVAITDYSMKQFSSYFVQIGGTDPEAEQGINFSQSRVTGRSSIVRRAPAEYEETEDTHPVWCAVDMTNSNGETDETTMLISDDFTDGYDIMNDLVKMRGTYYKYAQITTKPVLASRNNEGEMAFNALPDASAEAGIPLNYFTAYQGNYTISYNDKYGREEVKEVKLFDKTTNQWYDLMSDPYNFTTGREDNTTRFILSVRVERKKTPQIATDLDNVSGSEHPRKVLINGHVYIVRGKAVYDLTGKQVLNR